MPFSDIHDNCNFRPMYIFQSGGHHDDRDSILSSIYPSGGTKISIRTGCSRDSCVPYALETGFPPLVPPRRVKTAAPGIARNRLSKVPHRHPPLNVGQRLKRIVPSNSKYQQISQRCFLFQRRFLVVASVLALCVSVCMSSLVGCRFYKDLTTRLVKRSGNDQLQSQVNCSIVNVPISENLMISTSTYLARTVGAETNRVFGQVYFKSKSISEGSIVTLDIGSNSSNQRHIGNIIFSNENSLRIIHSGSYYVYSSIHYRITQEPAQSHTHWKHYIRRQTEYLAVAAYTCGYDCLNFNRTSYIAGIYLLCADDVINVSVYGNMHVYNESQTTYLGLFMTSEHTAAQCFSQK